MRTGASSLSPGEPCNPGMKFIRSRCVSRRESITLRIAIASCCALNFVERKQKTYDGVNCNQHPDGSQAQCDHCLKGIKLKIERIHIEE
jgi:hypothetical protein